MKILDNFNVICKSVVLLNRPITIDEIRVYSKCDINIPTKGEIYDVPNSKVKRDRGGMIRGNSIPLGFPVVGKLKYQTTILANHLYLTELSGDKRQDYVLSTVDKAWVFGTSVPDSSFKLFDTKTLFID